ncbi:MAG: hypothetical protein IJC78_05695 [Clostridia bacterium]|nr:hypothetical protein [Clostridia bacterium]
MKARINSATLAEIDTFATKSDISRNEFINQCIDFALQNLDPELLLKNTEDNS